ncbi:MAG: ParB/RepB/Spo0J family partition protein [Bacillota bacterium]|nr:ParB/RepB/Spo0J family partition protein [Bacillota bacterium]
MSGQGWLREIPLEAIVPGVYQPRQEMEEESLRELAGSIAQHGVIQPILVRPRAERFELVAGERRWRAAAMAGLRTIPAVVREMDDREAAMAALLENLQREDLHFFEEAEGYARLLAEFGLTQEELARQVGKSQSAIANKLRLLRLSPEARQIISREILSERHARALLALPDERGQKKAIQLCVQHGWTVRQLEGYIERQLQEKARKPKRQGVVRDVRILVNEFRRTVQLLKERGFAVQMEEAVEDGRVRLEIEIDLSALASREAKR